MASRIPHWFPASRGRGKRRAKVCDPWANAGKYRKATPEDVDKIVARIGLPIDACQKKLFLYALNLMLNVYDGDARDRNTPSQSEMHELLSKVEQAMKAALAALGVQRSLLEIADFNPQFGGRVLFGEINPAVRVALAKAASGNEQLPGEPSMNRVAVAASSIALLAKWAREAKKTARPRSKDSPERALSVPLAQLYRDFFGREPARTTGGPWLQFLRWALDIAGSPMRNRSDEALKKLPIGKC